MESERHSDPEIASTIHMAWWPRLVHAQEILVMLSEAEFRAVPADVRAQVELVFRGILSTYMAEEAMNILRQRCDSNRKHQLAVRQRWHALIADHLLEDHGREPVPPTEAPVSAGRSLPESMFRSNEADFSMPKEVLEGLVSPEYSGRSAEVWNQQSYLCASLLSLNGDFAAWKRAWRSLFFEPGSVLALPSGKDKKWKKPLLVLDVTLHGAVVWELSITATMAKRCYFEFKQCVAGRAAVNVLPITDLSDWCVWDPVVLPPCRKPSPRVELSDNRNLRHSFVFSV
eukprot:787909-Amphidinium_carterae.1